MGCLGDEPEVPDYEAAAIEGVYADVNTLEKRRKIEAAAKAGEKLTIDGKTYDFAGLGDADYALQHSKQMAETLLNVQEEFGEAYVAQRIAELEQADPEGRKVRRQLYDTIIGELESGRERPLAETAQAQIMSELLDSASLRPQVEREIGQRVRAGQVARGNYTGVGNVYDESKAIGDASDYQRQVRQQMALSWLASGATPEDVEYRKNQQDMSNLGSFLSGERPSAQFGQLSGAQAGSSPFWGGSPMQQGLNPNAGQMGAQYAQNIYSNQYNWDQSQVNPFVAGIGTTMQAFGAAGALGWQPFSGGGNNFVNIAQAGSAAPQGTITTPFGSMAG